MIRRLAIAGLAAVVAAPALVIERAPAAVAFTCSTVTGSATLNPGLVHDSRPQSMSSGPTAPAGPADITLASTNDAGVNADNDAQENVTLSADGEKVGFFATSTNLDPADTLSDLDAYVKDLTSGDVTLASASETGVKANKNVGYGDWGPSLSADGTKMVFATSATNLGPPDPNADGGIYVKDLTTGDVAVASISATGVDGTGGNPSISADGTRVAFNGYGAGWDPPGYSIYYDIYVKDLVTGELFLANASDTGVRGNGTAYDSYLSADGTKVAFFTTSTNLDPADTDDDYDVYVKDLTTGDITLASTSDTGVKGNSLSLYPSLSADGTKVAFTSRATNLDPRDTTGAVEDIYVKDLVTGDITLASTSDAGIKGNNNSTYARLSADGSKVAFNSIASNLDPADPNYLPADVYVKDLLTGDLTLAGASDTGVRSNGGSWGPALSFSADGTVVAFFSDSTNLDPSDAGDSGSTDAFVKQLPTSPTSVSIGGCSNGNSGTASIVDIRSYGPRPLGCPLSLGGAAGNDYADTTPILVGTNPTFRIDWASGPDSVGVAAAKAGPNGTQWRFRLAITASPGHDTPATNQYLPAVGSGLTKTRLQGKFDLSALDSFNCAIGVDDPLSWLSLANNGTWVAKTS